MVISHNFQDLFDISNKTAVFNLPVYRENPLLINFGVADGLWPVYENIPPVLPFAESTVFQANIIESRKLTAAGGACKKDVYEITLDVTGSNIIHHVGDTIGVIPQNTAAEVDQILCHLDLMSKVDSPYELSIDKSIKGAKVPQHVPVKSTLRYVLTNCLDLRSIVKKLFILALAKYTKQDNERKVLQYICSKEGSAAYTTHILNQHLCILDFFAAFPSCKPPIEVLLANLPRLLPRPYSIINSSKKDPNKLKICFSVMDLGNNRKGLTTGWLEKVIANEHLEDKMKNLSINSDDDQNDDDRIKVPIYLRKNVTGFLMPDNLATPLILLCAGTGVAPFLGFLEERQFLKEKDPNLQLGDTWLFFGCRDAKLDFIYEKELNEFHRNAVLNKICTAFSRLGDGPKYIQDAVLENGAAVTRMIEQGASVFVCGDLKNMAAQIKDVLVQCLVKYDGKSIKQAESYLTEMQKDKRYFVDAWI